MPDGKPAGVPCVHLTATLACDLFGDPRRPLVCSSLRPTAEMCGANREQALRYLDELEQQTAPLRRCVQSWPRWVSSDCSAMIFPDRTEQRRVGTGVVCSSRSRGSADH